MKKPVRFGKIKNDSFPRLPDEVVADLSHDQEYLYDICLGVIDGSLEEDFECREPGALCHSRWLTLANRILLLYITSRNPSKALRRLAFIVIQFFAPSWFWIKSHPLSKDGPKNLLKMIEFSRKLNKEEQLVAQKVIQRNGFYAHPENVLKAMLTDEDASIRQRAVEKILTLRMGSKEGKEEEEGEEEVGEEEGGEEEREEEQEEEDEDMEEEGKDDDEQDTFKSTLPLVSEERQAMEKASIRKFVVPKINMNAKNYPDLFDWSMTKFSEPPLTTHLSDDEIKEFLNAPFSPPDIPCHTQAVERGIRVITEAASSVIGQDSRDGFIRQKLKSRKDVGSCDSKKDFYPVLEDLKHK